MSRGPTRFAPAAVFRLTLAPNETPHDLRLRSAEWGLFFSITGRHTVAQLGAQLHLDRVRLEEGLVALLDRGLIVEKTLSLDEYLAAAATVGDVESVTLAEFLRARAQAPRDMPGALPPVPSTTDLPLEDAPFEPLPLPEPEDTNMANPPSPSGATRALNLRILIQALLEHAANPDAGQLDVYRTFLRIEPQLLRKNGITTLRFEDDRIVHDPELVAAIATSAAETLGGAVPDSVFAM